MQPLSVAISVSLVITGDCNKTKQALPNISWVSLATLYYWTEQSAMGMLLLVVIKGLS